jgi:hypothetical protein
MDQQLGPQPETPCPRGVGGQRVGIADGRADTVDRRRQSGRPGMHDQFAAEMVERRVVVSHVEVEHQVDAAEQQPRYAWRARHMGQIGKPCRRLQQAQHGVSGSSARSAASAALSALGSTIGERRPRGKSSHLRQSTRCQRH